MAGREDKIMVRINGDIKERFSKYCDEYGMTMSAMSAYLIGSFVRQQDQVTAPMLEALKETMVKVTGQAMQEEVETARAFLKAADAKDLEG